MPDRSSIEFRLILTLACIAFIAVLGLLLIVPYRLYERDIRNATTSAHRISNIVQAALRCPLTSGTDPGDLVSRIQLIGGMQIALAQLEAGEATPGAIAGRGSAPGPAATPLRAGRARHPPRARHPWSAATVLSVENP